MAIKHCIPMDSEKRECLFYSFKQMSMVSYISFYRYTLNPEAPAVTSLVSSAPSLTTTLCPTSSSVSRQNNKNATRDNNNMHLYIPSQIYTPPDHFLRRSHLIEAKDPPANLCNGSKFDRLSREVWNRFVRSQQTEDTYKKKMYLWRYLYTNIRVNRI